MHISQLFTSLVKAAVDDVYAHEFFDDAIITVDFKKWFWAVV